MNSQQQQLIQAYEDFARKVESIMGAKTPVSINVYDVPEVAFSAAADKHETPSNKWMMEQPHNRIILFSTHHKNEESKS